MARRDDPLTTEEIAILELLVLRHLYDGDTVEWPLPDDHPDRPLFEGLEAKGRIARWDRTWPLRDRYRITETGIAEIERHYAPAAAEPVLAELRAGKLRPAERRRWLEARGLDAATWPVLHDPFTHWTTWREDHGPNWRYVHEVPVERSQARPDAETRRKRIVDDLDVRADDRGTGWAVPHVDVS